MGKTAAHIKHMARTHLYTHAQLQVQAQVQLLLNESIPHKQIHIDMRIHVLHAHAHAHIQFISSALVYHSSAQGDKPLLFYLQFIACIIL